MRDFSPSIVPAQPSSCGIPSGVGPWSSGRTASAFSSASMLYSADLDAAGGPSCVARRRDAAPGRGARGARDAAAERRDQDREHDHGRHHERHDRHPARGGLLGEQAHRPTLSLLVFASEQGSLTGAAMP